MKKTFVIALLVALAASAAHGQGHRNADPMDATVRISVPTHGGLSFGSGTIVYSDDAISLVLSCAHIFEGGSRETSIEVFGRSSRGYAPWKTFKGGDPAIDQMHDLSLIAIRPGRRLPACRVVPPNWRAEPRWDTSTGRMASLKMIVASCPEGQNPTWYATRITNPQVDGLAGKPDYRAIECATAPKQGRSGGGLFTTDGHLAGVCNFADPRGNVGLFAHPSKIYGLLDRQDLPCVYEHTGGARYSELAETQQVRQRFGLFAGIVGRRGAIGMYAGPRPGVASSCPGGVCPTPGGSVPTNPGPVNPPADSSSSSSSSVVEVPPTPSAPPFDPTEIYKRLDIQQALIAKQAADLQKLKDTPITFVTPQPDGTEVKEAVRLGESIGLKSPVTPAPK